jgi:hypothetical protein
MIEAETIYSLKRHLQHRGLGPDSWLVTDIAVDSDGSYRRSPHAAELEPMMSIPISGFYPDLVCFYKGPSEEGLAAFEVKGAFEDWVKGMTQARAYREGVHRSYLALPSGSERRLRTLERDAQESGIGVWVLEHEQWHEIVPAARPRPSLAESRDLIAAIQGVVLPRRLQLNHPLNYLAVVWIRAHFSNTDLMEGLEKLWGDLRTSGSRQHAINGARYLGLLAHDDSLTKLGITVADLMESLGFGENRNLNKRRRLFDESSGLAAIIRLVLTQQGSTDLVVQTLEKAGNVEMNTEEMLIEGSKINKPLASGLFLADPKDIEKHFIPASAFSPSFVFQFKQTLWHAGILSTPAHRSAGKGAAVYDSKDDR